MRKTQAIGRPNLKRFEVRPQLESLKGLFGSPRILKGQGWRQTFSKKLSRLLGRALLLFAQTEIHQQGRGNAAAQEAQEQGNQTRPSKALNQGLARCHRQRVFARAPIGERRHHGVAPAVGVLHPQSPTKPLRMA